MKILIIHSDKKLTNTIIDQLPEAQYEIHYAADGESGLELAMVSKFDLIVMDWMLQKRDGLSVLKKLRQQKKTVPILMMIADYSMKDIIQSLDFGANDCISKPFHIYVLIARMKALIRRSKWDLCAEISNDNHRISNIDKTIY